jgi:outer membrane protein W
MKKWNVVVVSALALSQFAIGAYAQKWEVGGFGGGSFSTSNDVVKGSSSVKASFTPGFSAGVFLNQEMGRHWGGEIRYTFQRSDAQLDGNGAKASFGAQSHAVHYEFQYHFSPSGEKTRAYVLFGAGIKYYRGTGNEVVSQPLSDFALLTKTSDTTPVAVVGFGVKFRVSDKSNMRVEIRDYLSPVPSKIFAPNRNSSVDGWINNLVPTVGISYIF